MPKLFDTHAHLLDERFDTDRDALLSVLPESGIALMMEACCDESGIDKVIALTQAHDYVYGSAGVHPHSAEEMNNGTMDHIRRALLQEKIKAIGEIGLDYHYDFSPRELQRRWFNEQLDLAGELDVPVIIHDREAHGDCMDAIRARRGRIRGVMHCFSGSLETALICIDCGLYVAFGGALTFKNAVRQREIASKLPAERLLIETDCPYMTPVPYRGQRNDPRMIRLTLETLAEVRNADIEELAAALFENGKRAFDIA
ncbi:MAG TPA: TatD family hydrolase [Clostridia bacterium]|nr:TatD family hydrolase [Clostridia bacterium]